ncbi:MAG TPA: manganese efflux pump [Candidatus Dormibacteraeota bacterium]|jgi:putative Mn2+ efflux pump MntP|nr:manganese efflux pump [Candidatus Dormibacteraeota bacterium]
MRQLLVTAGLLLPLGLDTFALAAALGVAGLEAKDRLRVSLVFSIFEAAMPIAGILAGRVIGNLLGTYAEYAGILFLFLAGLIFLRPGKDEDEDEQRLQLLARVRGPAVLGLGISISLDELTIGLSAGLLGLSIVVTVVWVTIQAFLATQVGLRFGALVGERLRERSEAAAGVALIAVALILLALKALKL